MPFVPYRSAAEPQRFHGGVTEGRGPVGAVFQEDAIPTGSWRVGVLLSDRICMYGELTAQNSQVQVGFGRVKMMCTHHKYCDYQSKMMHSKL